MGISGRSIEKDYSLEQMIDLVHKYHGRVRDIARASGYTPRAIYDYIDVYPELQEARRIAGYRFRDIGKSTADEVLDKLMEMVENEPAQANRAAQFILKNNKESDYYDDKSADDKKEEKMDEWIGTLKSYVNKRVTQS